MRLRTGTVAILFLFICGQATIGSAQYRRGWGWGGGGGYRHASTAAEGAARGMADVIRSAGAANLMNSEAAINIETARKGYIENRLNATNTYFEMRRVNKQAREAERTRPRPTQQDLIRISNARKPRRLATSQLDPLTGSIAWPILLRDDKYKEERQQLDNLYTERAKNGYLNASQLKEVEVLTNTMQAELKKGLSDVQPQLYTQAKGFLTSLQYESMLQPG